MFKFETKKDVWKFIRAILEAALLIVVLFFATRTLTTSKEYTPYDPADPNVVSGADQGFLAVSYFGVDRQSTDTLVSVRQLDAQLGALHSLGYVTVSQEDVANYYTRGTALPDKALFLLFEDGRRDTAMYAEKILEKYNYKATILTYADKFQEKDPKFLSSKDLTKLLETGYWELGTNGYRLSYINVFDRYDRFLDQLTSDEYSQVHSYLGRDYNHYLMDFIRDEDRLPTETTREMESRITQDYRSMEEIYTQELGQVPGLYCLMHANSGAFGNTKSVSEANGKNIQALFRMNFNRDGYSLNSRTSSIYDLTRIQPQASWNTNHLLMRLWDDLPDSRKEEILFVSGAPDTAEAESKKWTLQKGAVEYESDSIILTTLPRNEGLLWLKDRSAENVTVEAELLGNQIGGQTLFLRADEERTRYLAVSLQNNRLIVSEAFNGNTTDLFSLDLHDLVPVKDRVSVEEDSRAALAAEFTTRGRFAKSPADSLVFYSAANEARRLPAASVAEGAEEYIPEMEINDLGRIRLTVQLEGDTLRCLVDGQDVTGAISVGVSGSGGIAIGSNWGGWGYSQRNVADDVYDGVFHNLTITENGVRLYDNRLTGVNRLWHTLKSAWSDTINWFVRNL